MESLEKVTEQVIGTRIRKVSLNFPSKNPLTLIFELGLAYFGKSSCINCGSSKVYKLQVLEDFIVQDRQNFGRRVKPVVNTRLLNTRYGCKSCHAESDSYKTIVRPRQID